MERFWVTGINYKKTDTSVRGLFAVNPDQYSYLLSIAHEYDVKELFILSTCNRTEIYGIAEDVQSLINLMCSVCKGDSATFAQIAYQKNGEDAVNHLFHVAAGLDSQILGDFEILGQIKSAVKVAKAGGFIGAFMERLVNSVFQSAKAIKTNTQLSGGTVSVSFAAIQYIRQEMPDVSNKKIVLVGTGKIGKTTCRNIIDYLATHNITLVNRTIETAEALANELNVGFSPVADLASELAAADIILVSTNSAQPVVLKQHLDGHGAKLVIDLSVPCNVEEDAGTLPDITLVNVDTLSKIKDETLEKRKAEVPVALAIIEEHVADFSKWLEMRRHVPMLKKVKSTLKDIQIVVLPTYNGCPSGGKASGDDTIQNVINVLATKMRLNNTPGCHYIEAINDFIAYHE